MLFFRFDFNKEDFKGENHKSVLYGESARDMAEFKFEEGSVNNYYLDEYNKIREQYFDNDEISEEEYDEKFNNLVDEFIEDEWTLNGCSCFYLDEEGIESAKQYGSIVERPIITIFEGEDVGSGHDGEDVAKCEKIIFQGNSDKIVDVFYDKDIENKAEYILNLVK